MGILSGTTKEFIVRQEGNRVLLILNGRLVASMPWQVAANLGKAIYAKSKVAEEVAHAEQIIGDQAILTRLGVSFGLSNNPHILKAAANEAAWNTDLRRFIRPDRARGIVSQEIFGTPKIVQHAPKEKTA